MTQPEPLEMRRVPPKPLEVDPPVGMVEREDGSLDLETSEEAQRRVDDLRARFSTPAGAPATNPHVGSGRPPTWYPAQNEHVAYLQERLRLWGFPTDGDPAGVFSASTEAAVRLFQSARGLRPDAFVGPQTWGELEMAPPERKG